MLGGYCRCRQDFDDSCAGDKYVNLVLLGGDLLVETVNVLRIGNVGLNYCRVVSDGSGGRLDLGLKTANNENVGAFFDESFGDSPARFRCCLR